MLDFSVFSTFKTLSRSQIFDEQLLFKHGVLSFFGADLYTQDDDLTKSQEAFV